jgi:cell division protein ZapA (FtsZ GTPase activity inhibitor)
MSALIPINIVIGDRSYRVKSNPSDEEAIRKTIKIVNDKIIEFRSQFAGKDMQDYIAMVLLWYATQVGSDNNPVLEKELAEALLKLEQQIDEAL